MKPHRRTPQTAEMFRPRLDEFLNMAHPLIRLAGLMDWELVEHHFAGHFTSGRGRPALPPRLVAGLLYLQHANDASDEMVVNTWLENPTAEVIHRRGPWKTKQAVELATLEWVSWFNHHRLMGPLGNVPPAEFEANYHQQRAGQAATA